MPTISEALAIATQHHQAGRLDLAEEIYRRILAVEPQHAQALHQHGLALHQQGQQASAADTIRRAIGADPTQAPFHNSLGEVYRVSGMPAEAAACYQRALELFPGYAEAHYNLGLLLQNGRREEQAILCYRRALALNPDIGVAHNNLGVLLLRRNQVDEAAEHFLAATRLNPYDADALDNLACARRDQGNPAEAMELYRQAVRLAPREPNIASNLLLCMHYLSESGPRELAAAHQWFDRQYGQPLRATWRPHANDRDPDRRLRLGFVSPDFGRHPVGFFLVGVLENFEAADVAAVCFSDRIAADDEITVRLKARADAWCETAALSDEQLAERIREERIDILFDLAGHTGGNRLPVFARKPAPVQVTWMGYVGTTGLGAMDFLLADRHQAPDGAEAFCCEKVLRMPDGYVCWSPPSAAPEVGPLPCDVRGHVTFGCFNNPAKVNGEVLRVWGEVLRRVPDSHLVLRYAGFDGAEIRRRTGAALATAGIDAARLEMYGWTPHADALGAYNQVDIALDPFPYSGGLTTCEALWMGVPVVTCPGDTFASRHALSHLSTVGLEETVAGSLDETIELAVGLANDRARLAGLRAGLRARVASSPLVDGRRFAGHLIELLRGAWRAWAAPTR